MKRAGTCRLGSVLRSPFFSYLPRLQAASGFSARQNPAFVSISSEPASEFSYPSRHGDFEGGRDRERELAALTRLDELLVERAKQR